MQLHRNEIKTGILAISSLTVLFLTIMYLGAPGMLKSFKTFYVIIPNAAGMKSGDPVYLAGRKVGQVTSLESPIPLRMRPVGFETYEVRVGISVDKKTAIYNKVNVSLQQLGLLGDQSIDFQNGDETSGLAPKDTTFVGEKVMDFREIGPAMLGMVKPVAQEMTAVLAESKKAVRGFNDLMGDKGTLQQAAGNFRDFSDTIKREPWRLIRKSTKTYEGDPEPKKDVKSSN